MAVNVADVLERAADMLEPAGAWTQHSYARDRGGSPVLALSPDAVCWCIVGAVKRAGNYRTDMDASPVLDVLDRSFKRGSDYPIEWNDSARRKQEQVVAKLRAAAKLARAKP